MSLRRRSAAVLVMMSAAAITLLVREPGSPAWAGTTTTIQLSPTGTSACVGTQHTVKAVVSGPHDDGFWFTVNGDSERITPTTTDKITYFGTYTASAAGLDHITASTTVNESTVTSNEVTHTWLGPSLSLGPDGTSAETGTTHQVTASVNCGSGTVNFAVVSGPNAGRNLGSDSTAPYTASYTSAVTGTDSIQATMDVGDGSISSRPVRHTWSPVVVGMGLSVLPTTTCVGGQSTAAATVTHAGRPVPSVTVVFRMSMPGRGDVTVTGATNSAGRAVGVLTQAVSGVSTVTASVRVGTGSASAGPVALRWNPCLVVVTLQPAAGHSPVHSTFTTTASVTYRGRPAAGSTVRLTATLPGQPTLTMLSTTTQSGRASFTYRRDNPGTEQLLALVTVNGQPGQGAGEHSWDPPVIGAPPPNHPTLGTTSGEPPSLGTSNPNPLPGSPETAVGRGCLPSSPVELTLSGIGVGSSTADNRGRFRIPFQMPALPVGRHMLLATCGGTTIDAPLDLVMTSASVGAGAPAVTTVMVLLFFVLLGSQIIRPGSASPSTSIRLPAVG
jgi:hypothetical protein